MGSSATDILYPSLAHERSAPFIIDPTYSAVECAPSPAVVTDEVWLYGEGELECYRLAVLRKRAKEANLKIYYPGSFHTPSRHGLFRLNVDDSYLLPETCSFRANGHVVVKFGCAITYASDPCTEIHTFALNCDCSQSQVGALVVEITTTAGAVDSADQMPGEPPCLWIPGDSPLSSPQSWEWSNDGSVWMHARTFAANESFAYPHLVEAPEVRLVPKTQLDDSIYDFGCELLGRVVVSCENVKAKPVIFIGESIVEAMNDDSEHFEQSTGMITDDESSGTWQSKHLLAFRYVRVAGCNGVKEIVCDAVFHPVQYLGAFAASDELLTRIWMNSAYTLRLCMHDFLVDGIKRDRLPWAGDLAVSLLANAYTFADGEIVRRSLMVLGRAGINQTDINGIVDYTLWWIICQDLYQLYFEDIEHLEREWIRVHETLNCLLERCNDDGFLQIDEGRDWVFIDWVELGGKMTSLQVLFWWALDCGLRLAERVSDNETINRLQHRQDALKSSLLSSAWDEATGLWRSSPGEVAEYSRHANILAVVSGLTLERREQIMKSLLEKDLVAVGTPYMKNFECLALARLGAEQMGTAALRSYWGSMTENGATTYWESFDDNGSGGEITEFYGRPFGRSFCHAWSAGPCHLLPEIILGIRPLADGWAKWTCHPQLCGLEWISATVPTLRGCIEMEASSVSVRIVVPEGTTLFVNGTSFPGPDTIIQPMNKASDMNTINANAIKEWSAPYRGWHYYSDHVVPPKPSIPGFDDVHMTDVPTVYQLPEEDGKWYMSFVGFNGKGYQSLVAESDDLLNWTNARLAMGFGKAGEFDYGGCVIGAYLYEDYDIKASRTLKKKDGKYWSLYGAYSKQGQYEIDPGYEGLASSHDGLTWQRAKEQYILSIYDDNVQDWERDSIYQPWLVEHDGRYWNFYNAKQMPEWIEQIGLATSADLQDWERHPQNPVLRVRPDGFDTEFVADGKVFRDGNHWTMFYFGVGQGGAHIMIAFSRDLIHWTADSEPLYKAGGNPSGLDSQYAHKISLVWNPKNETWYMYYDAVGDKGRGIGLITSREL